MQEVRRHPRMACRLAVDLCIWPEETPCQCRTLDIGLGGLFLTGAPSLRPEQPLSVTFGRRERESEQLQMNARIVRVTAEGAGCAFAEHGQQTMLMLKALLTPDWDGKNLLDGVMKIAPWYHGTDLAAWMRLTSIVSDWHRLRSRTRPDF